MPCSHMYDDILVPTDGREGMERARITRWLSRSCGTLHVLYVMKNDVGQVVTFHTGEQETLEEELQEVVRT